CSPSGWPIRGGRAALHRGTAFASGPAVEPTFFERIKSYVGFKGESSAALLALHPLAQPHFASIVDDFYAAIEADPDARAAITGGPAQIERLKQTLIRWLELM